jgi:hypothetical protein
MKKLNFYLLITITFLVGCKNTNPKSELAALKAHRFFSDDSFWNQPIPENPEIDPKNDQWIALLKTEPTKNNFSLQYSHFTQPIYDADSTTPLYKIKYHYLSDSDKLAWHTNHERFGHGPSFDMMPIPDDAMPDPAGDAQIIVVDWQKKLAWDTWQVHKTSDSGWESNTGMVYRIDGTGVFCADSLGLIDSESVHFHGPCSASGKPLIAGIVRYDEIMSGKLEHKLICESRFVALREYVYPAIWTDGPVEGGIPEGTVIQLDPKLDLSKFDLTPDEVIIAKTMQKYGMVLTDFAGGQVIVVEGLYGHPDKSWEGKLNKEWTKKGINSIPYDCYRILKVNNSVHKGDAKSMFNKGAYDGTWKSHGK